MMLDRRIFAVLASSSTGASSSSSAMQTTTARQRRVMVTSFDNSKKKIRTWMSYNTWYVFKNQKVTVQQVDYFSEALAIGFAENGLIPGDVVVSWVP